MRCRALLFFLLSLFLFVACSSKAPPRVAILEKDRDPILGQVSRYLRSLQKIGSVKAYAKVRLKVKGRKASFDEVIKIRFPFSFYFETLDDLANTRYQMISEGARLFWQDFDRKEFWEGDLDEKTLRKFLPMASNLEETLGLFIGKLPLVDLKEAKVFAGSASQYFIRIPRGEILWDSSQNVIVRLALKAEDAKFAFEYEGRRFHSRVLYPTKETEMWLPSYIKLKDKKTGNEIEINYQEEEVGTGPLLLSSPFQFQALPDAKKIDALP